MHIFFGNALNKQTFNQKLIQINWIKKSASYLWIVKDPPTLKTKQIKAKQISLVYVKIFLSLLESAPMSIQKPSMAGLNWPKIT